MMPAVLGGHRPILHASLTKLQHENPYIHSFMPCTHRPSSCARWRMMLLNNPRQMMMTMQRCIHLFPSKQRTGESNRVRVPAIKPPLICAAYLESAQVMQLSPHKAVPRVRGGRRRPVLLITATAAAAAAAAAAAVAAVAPSTVMTAGVIRFVGLLLMGG